MHSNDAIVGSMPIAGPKKGALKLCFFVPPSRGVFAGIERVQMLLASECAKRGHTVFLLLSEPLRHVPVLAEGITLNHLGASRLRDCFGALSRWFSREECDFAIVPQYLAAVLAGAARVLAKVHTKVICVLHGPVSKDNSIFERALRRGPLALAYQHLVAGTLAISKAMLEDFREATSAKPKMARVVYNPIDLQSIAGAAAEKPEGDWFGNCDSTRILAVGRLEIQKDFETLIRAFRLVRRKRAARLLILGEGMQRARLEALTRELGLERDVSMPGFAENPFPYMRGADVLVLSSRWEGLGLVLLEAMALGTPVVATNIAPAAEILENGRLGRLTPVEDAPAMARAILATVNARPESQRLVAAARKYSVDSIADRYLEVLQELA